MKKLGIVDWLALLLLLFAGLHFGLLGLLGFNLMAVVLGGAVGLTKVVYMLIGVAAVYELYKAVAHK